MNTTAPISARHKVLLVLIIFVLLLADLLVYARTSNHGGYGALAAVIYTLIVNGIGIVVFILAAYLIKEKTKKLPLWYVFAVIILPIVSAAAMLAIIFSSYSWSDC